MSTEPNKAAAGAPGLVAGVIAVLGFFLPMVRGCGFADASAAQIASESPEYYLYIIAGGVGIVTGVLLLIKVSTPAFIAQGIGGGLAFLHLVIQTIRVKAEDDMGIIEPLVGYYVLLLALGVLAIYPWIGLATSRSRDNEW